MLYSIFVVIEMVLHLIRHMRHSGKTEEALVHAEKKDLKLILMMDLLQIPLSIVFTRFLNVFSALIPNLYSDEDSTAGGLAVRVIILGIAIILTGIGAAMSLICICRASRGRGSGDDPRHDRCGTIHCGVQSFYI